MYRTIFSYVIIKVYGDFPERILNLCAKNQISTWNVHRQKGYIELCIMMKDFKRLHQIRGKSGVRIKIIKKCGFRIIVSKYKLRMGMVIGIVLFLAILKLLSGFVWDIEIVGAKNTSKEEIIGLCKSQGIYIGQYIKNINTMISKDKILLDSDKLAWAAVNVEGSKITVNVTEVKSQIPEFSPSNIIATDDAVIKNIKVLSGNSQIKIGDAVQKGDLLISGTVDIGDRVNFIKSSGEILGEIETKIVISKPYIQEMKKYTSENKQKFVLEFFGFKLPIFLGETKGNFTENYSKQQLQFLKHKMPIILHKKQYDFFTTYNAQFKKSELINQIEIEFEKEVKRKKLENVTVISREIYQDDTSVTVEYIIKHIKNICREENLIITTLN